MYSTIKKGTLIICFISFLSSYSQLDFGFQSQKGQSINQTNLQKSTNYYLTGVKITRPSSSNSKDIIGTPYINEEYEVINIKGIKDKYRARYNAVTHQIEVIVNNGVIELDRNRNYEVTFIDSNKTYKNTKYISKKGVKQQQYMVLVKETKNYLIFKSENIKFFDQINATTSYQTQKKASYKRQEDSFYIKTQKEFTPIPAKMNSLFKIYPEQKDKLKKFIKKNNIKLSDENDIIKLYNYIFSK